MLNELSNEDTEGSRTGSADGTAPGTPDGSSDDISKLKWKELQRKLLNKFIEIPHSTDGLKNVEDGSLFLKSYKERYPLQKKLLDYKDNLELFHKKIINYYQRSRRRVSNEAFTGMSSTWR